MDKFASGVVSELNKFRINPQCVAKRIETFRRGLSRLKAGDPFLKEIDEFVNRLPSVKPMAEFQINEILCDAAKSQLDVFIQDPDSYTNYRKGFELDGIVPKYYLKEEPVLIADDGAENPEDIVSKCLLNKIDYGRVGRGTLCSNDYTQLGIAHILKDGENYVMLIFAYKKAKKRSDMELPPGDLTELKQAFDLFDVQNEGEISPHDTLEAMKNLGYDKSNPELYRIMSELDTPENDTVDFPLFANHIIGMISDKTTEDGIRTIFNLFVDDPKEGTVSALNLKKIIEELGEKPSQEKINKILSMKGGVNAKLTFEEFLDYMKSTYGDGPETNAKISTTVNTRTTPGRSSRITKTTITTTTTTVTTGVRRGGNETTSGRSNRSRKW